MTKERQQAQLPPVDASERATAWLYAREGGVGFECLSTVDQEHWRKQGREIAAIVALPPVDADEVGRVAAIIDPDAWSGKLPTDGLGKHWHDRRNRAREKARAAIAALSSDRLQREAWPEGDAGDAVDWACDHIGFNDPRDFLEAWREGRLDEYPDYLKWVAFQQKCAAESRQARTALHSEERGDG